MYIALLANVLLVLALILGLALTLIGLPGNLLILIAAIVYGWQENFVHVTYACLLLLALLWGGGELAEFFAGIKGAKSQQASRWGMLAAFIGSIAGGILGTGMLPLLGTLLGAAAGGFLASFFVEYLYTRDKEKAHAVAKGALKGQLQGMLAKLIVAVSMAAIIVYKLWF